MLKQRLIFGTIGIVLALFVLLYCSVAIISSIVAIISLIGLYEFFKVSGFFAKKSPCVYVGFAFAIILFALAVFADEILKKNVLFIITTYIFVLMSLMVLFRDKVSFNDIALNLIGTAYISMFFLHIIFIRKTELGNFSIWLIFIPSWTTDTFAYFAGRLFGKHKLCPKISPKKTVEGAIGGTAGCILSVCLYGFLCTKYANVTVNYINAIVFSTFAAVFSQVGDLAASCIKRDYNVKDYGNLIPGHGGILDRFDSALLIAPLVYYILMVIPVFSIL